MPVLTNLHQRASSAADTRTFDSRQLLPLIRQTLSTLQPALRKRQNTIVAIPTIYQGLNAGPSPGIVVAIVLGAVAGFLLLIWLLWALSNGGGFIRTSQLEEEDVVIRRSKGRSRSRRGSHRTEMTSRSPRRERIIRQERIVREVPAPRAPSRIRETVIVNEGRGERRVDGDDIVEVIEEHSEISGAGPPPRRKSKRNGGYR